jgi:hypothetical protein
MTNSRVSERGTATATTAAAAATTAAATPTAAATGRWLRRWWEGGGGGGEIGLGRELATGQFCQGGDGRHRGLDW